MANNENVRKITTKKHLARKQREARQMKIIIAAAIVVGALILGLVGYGLIEQLILRPSTPVAEVGDQVITVGEFETRVKYARQQALNQSIQYFSYAQQFGDLGQSFYDTAQSLVMQLMDPVAFAGGVMDELIDNIIIQEEAEKRGLSVSEAEIDQTLYTSFGFFPNGTLTPTQTATTFATPTYSATQLAIVPATSTPTATEEPAPTSDATDGAVETEDSEISPALTDTNGSDSEGDVPSDQLPEAVVTPTITLTPTPYTTEVLGDNIKQFNKEYRIYGFDIQDLRDIIAADLLREKLLDSVITDLDTMQEEVWARHILVDSEDIAQEVLDKLDAGEDWSTLAAEYSQDEGNKDNGGDLGWFTNDRMVAPFSEKAFALETGEISEPVETTFGFHIIQSLGKREVPIPAGKLRENKQIAFREWLSEIRTNRDDITIYDNWETYVPTKPEVPPALLAQLYQ